MTSLTPISNHPDPPDSTTPTPIRRSTRIKKHPSIDSASIGKCFINLMDPEFIKKATKSSLRRSLFRKSQATNVPTHNETKTPTNYYAPIDDVEMVEESEPD